MSNQNNGGPAFPGSENGTSHTIAMAAMLQLPETASTDEKDKVYIQTKASAMQGMSLRDYFAAKCDVSQYAPGDLFYRTYSRNPDATERAKLIAEIRYIEADAMLAARSA